VQDEDLRVGQRVAVPREDRGVSRVAAHRGEQLVVDEDGSVELSRRAPTAC
jgi:hypothetical protein